MSESLAGVLFVTSLAVALVVVHRPLGDLLFWVATSPRDLAPERFAYRLVGADPKTEQSWGVYTLDVAVARDQHDLRVDLALAQARQRRQAVHSREPDVEDDEIEGVAGDALEAVFTARHGVDRVALISQHPAEGGADARLVVDNQNGWFHR